AVGAVVTLIVAIISSFFFRSEDQDTNIIRDFAQNFEFDRTKMAILIGYFALIVFISMNISKLFT
ncbi:MAG: hypothetical protein DWQ02_25010, partial [Bacteroidetes bacterium]